MSPLKVSVIIPNYNYANYLERRLQSILNQDYPIYELVFLDDASTDGSVSEIVKAIDQIKKDHPDINIKTAFNAQNTHNVCIQWQRGINMANGDYIWIAEMDDFAEPNFLSVAMQPFVQDPSVILSYTDSKIVNPENKIVIKRTIRQLINKIKNPARYASYVHDGRDEIRSSLCIYNTIPNVSAVVFRKKEGVSDILNKSSEFSIAGDWFFYIKLAMQGKIAYSSKKLNHYCIHEDSVTKTVDHEKYLAETQQIHEFIKKELDIPQKTQKAMLSHEQYLKKRWKLL